MAGHNMDTWHVYLIEGHILEAWWWCAVHNDVCAPCALLQIHCALAIFKGNVSIFGNYISFGIKP